MAKPPASKSKTRKVAGTGKKKPDRSRPAKKTPKIKPKRESFAVTLTPPTSLTPCETIVTIPPITIPPFGMPPTVIPPVTVPPFSIPVPCPCSTCDYLETGVWGLVYRNAAGECECLPFPGTGEKVLKGDEHGPYWANA